MYAKIGRRSIKIFQDKKSDVFKKNHFTPEFHII